MSPTYVSELQFCIKLWEEKKGCSFGWGTHCEDCAVPYLLYKFITGEVLHDAPRLTLAEWQVKVQDL